jgi:hypothetical protein
MHVCTGTSYKKAQWVLREVLMKIWRVLLASLLLALPGRSENSITDEAFAPGTVGHWKGNARIIVAWAKQTNLCVTLHIRDDASVTGKVGDALLTNGRLKRNRGWIGQNLKVKTDYIIVGDLEGGIIASEGITRSRVKIPLNLNGGVLAGGIHTSGCKFGGKEQMILSAAGLTLRRVDAR